MEASKIEALQLFSKTDTNYKCYISPLENKGIWTLDFFFLNEYCIFEIMFRGNLAHFNLISCIHSYIAPSTA